MGSAAPGAAETGKGYVLSAGARDVPLACRAQRHRCGGETLRRTCGRGGESWANSRWRSMKPQRRVALSPQGKGCRGAGESWRAGLNRRSRADTGPDRRSERKPVARKGALPWRHWELHGLRANSPAVGRRTSTGVRRLRVQERC